MPANDKDYLLIPSSPLVFGTGKPLDFGLGGDTLDFPFPPTLAGALRAAEQTAKGQDANPFAASPTLGNDPAAATATLGPAALARVHVANGAAELLFTPPADAVYFNIPSLHVRALCPADREDDVYTDLDEPGDVHRPGAAPLQLLRFSPPLSDDEKPADPPTAWTASELEHWLARAPVAAEFAAPTGVDGTGRDARSHVSIRESTRGADAGLLFRTTGRDFSARLSEWAPPAAPENAVAPDRPRPVIGGAVDWRAMVDEQARIKREQRVAQAPQNVVQSTTAFHFDFAIALRANSAAELNGVVRRVGGEGRFARIQRASAPLKWPEAPANLPTVIGDGASARVRFVLITPAQFAGGWAPCETLARGVGNGGEGWFTRCGVTCRIAAVALPRAQAFSGWQKGNDGEVGPGLPARIVPAGTVYWLEVKQGNPPSALHNQSLCADELAADGWGFGLVGLA